jgi:hypothetical protein
MVERLDISHERAQLVERLGAVAYAENHHTHEFPEGVLARLGALDEECQVAGPRQRVGLGRARLFVRTHIDSYTRSANMSF